jgi:argininosuccinate lyase
MAADSERTQQLGVGARLGEAPSPSLVTAFGSELRYAADLFEGLSYADLAHTIMLMETGIVPADAGRALLEALVALHDAGLAALPLDAKWGDLYNNRDAELTRRLGKGAGWLHAGRARREALTLAWLIHLRTAGQGLLSEAAHLARALATTAVRHAETVMPDFTYLQHAQPTTLGHFLLGFAYPVVRDAHRLARELETLNASPAGAASTNGSRLPLDRQRVADLLGFPRLVVHARDAMWQSDVPINLMAVVVSLATTADRLAEELQIWATDEFSFIALADRHCRTSVIMPNKKNPYALAVIRGTARDLAGRLMSVIATNQTPSGQLDNRNAAYEIVPEAVRNTRTALTLLAEVVETASFNTDRLRHQAETGFTYGTELADLLMQRERIDARTAHEIVGGVVGEMTQAAADTSLAARLKARYSAVTGKPMRTPVAELLPALSPDRIVANRQGMGSCAPSQVQEMAASIHGDASALVQASRNAATAAGFPAHLRAAVAQHLGRSW